jgi:hypothetical protein
MIARRQYAKIFLPEQPQTLPVTGLIRDHVTVVAASIGTHVYAPYSSSSTKHLTVHTEPGGCSANGSSLSILPKASWHIWLQRLLAFEVHMRQEMAGRDMRGQGNVLQEHKARKRTYTDNKTSEQ